MIRIGNRADNGEHPSEKEKDEYLDTNHWFPSRREEPLTFCRSGFSFTKRNGWQIAMYRSIENNRIVNDDTELKFDSRSLFSFLLLTLSSQLTTPSDCRRSLGTARGTGIFDETGVPSPYPTWFQFTYISNGSPTHIVTKSDIARFNK